MSHRPAMTMTRQQTRQEVYAGEVFSGNDAAARRLRLQVGRIAPHFRSTLLVGEAGVGKQTVAEELHRLSPAAGQFVAIAAEDAVRSEELWGDGGTVYLHGLESLAGELQELLPRRLKELERRWRVVLGSECDLRGMVAAGRMSAEVYAALAMPEIRVVPLRERGEVEEIAGAMLRKVGDGATYSPDALGVMRRYCWPGNLAELWAVCEQVGKPGTVVRAEDLPARVRGRREETLRLDEVVARHVRDVLQRCAGNKLKAAELLGISRSTLYRMLEA